MKKANYRSGIFSRAIKFILAISLYFGLVYWCDRTGVKSAQSEIMSINDAWQRKNFHIANNKIKAFFSEHRDQINMNPIKFNNAWFVRGKINYSIEKYDSAIIFLNKALAMDIKNDNIWLFLGLTKNEMGDYHSGVYALTKAIRSNPKNSDAWLYRAIVRGKKADYIGMISDCSKAIAIDSKNALAWNRRGWAEEQIGEFEKAKQDYEVANKKDPISVDFQIDYYKFDRDTSIEQRVINSASKSKIHLVAIGVGIYQQDYQFNSLEFSVPGALAIKNLFEKRNLTYNALFLHDSGARRKDILNALMNFSNSKVVKKSDFVIFYFSGHGLLVGNQTGICPYDYQSSKDLISDQEIIDLLKRSPARHKVCFIEACKNEKSADFIDSEMITEFNKKRQGIAPGIMFMTSTEVGKKSWGGLEGYFTKAIMQALDEGFADKDGNNFISAEELFTYVNTTVKRITKNQQVPQINFGYPKKLEIMRITL